MADFTSGFWNWYIFILVVLSFAFCFALIIWMSRGKRPAKVETMGHVWDGDLAEYNNPLPMWWLYMFYITLFFGIVYLLLYPGSGVYGGLLKWSEVGQWQKEVDRAEAKFGPLYEKYRGQDLKAVAMDDEANKMGRRLYMTYCTACHGSDAGGGPGYPNLRDGDWLYGGEPATILETITNGRMGVMPPQGAALGDDGVKNVVAYVRTLSGMNADPLRAQQGREKFAQLCAACHGPEGKGNPALGAPNLTDSVWLYGSSEATITETVTKGRNMNVSEGTLAMPAFKDVLGKERIHLVAAYVWSLSNKGAAK
jgi:cytochrome c oxidase cbb3-type subunit 3